MFSATIQHLASAAAPFIAEWLRGIAASIRQARHDRQTRRAMAELSNHLLYDIGHLPEATTARIIQS